MPSSRRLSWNGEFPENFQLLRIGRRESTSTSRYHGRERGIVYRHHNEVPTREIAACGDVWEKLGQTLGPNFKFEDVNVNGLWDLVFEDGWTTADSVGKRPFPAPRDDSQLVVMVGRWKAHLPKASADMPDIAERRRWAKAFVKFSCINDGHSFSSTFMFCDRWGHEAPQSYIDFDYSEHANYFGKAVEKFEKHEVNRLKTYNEDLAVYIVRRRLQVWAQHGFKLPCAGPYSRDDEDVRTYRDDAADMEEFRGLAWPLGTLQLMANALTQFEDIKVAKF
ncbi:hypothetical protein CkaCkLH20_12979 [Colletotrichum karsti]|uniref:Uncharacterized protein n=1 Tax=Colletotrichum karsti TaxID=1095194 RepID=A0A9P6HWI9_9PEZI|nr:uncharacterized protein CkaCkLH20_12979 [Colletotrichum karsti]KAF9869586.1 hypothetical protein CkaCkLH20_12979 [Colletotrichum karsti]